MKATGQGLLTIAMLSSMSPVAADWHRLSSHTRGGVIEINTGTVKQTGPMAIYRQVQVRSQENEKEGDALTTQLYEYDCMGSKMRILNKPEPQWQELPEHPLGQETFQLLCPSGRDD
jgi:hypothetical protein